MSSRQLMTLALIRNSSRLLLGWKKRGIGKERWNGFGGKVDEGESIEAAAKRELYEECGLKTENLKKVGIIDFEFENNPQVLEVHVFTTSKYEGEPQETPEMKPCWFDVDKLPFTEMWPDDRYWYPLFLEGKHFRGYMKFRGTDVLLDCKLDVVPDIQALSS